MIPKDVKINFPKIRNNIFKKKKNCIYILFSKMVYECFSEGFQILLTQV
jgi:hypothetical protein